MSGAEPVPPSRWAPFLSLGILMAIPAAVVPVTILLVRWIPAPGNSVGLTIAIFGVALAFLCWFGLRFIRPLARQRQTRGQTPTAHLDLSRPGAMLTSVASTLGRDIAKLLGMSGVRTR